MRRLRFGRWVISLAAALLACSGRSHSEVQADFAEAVAQVNRCEASETCVYFTADCPLGCSHAVPESAVPELERKARELIADYERGGRSCAYDCAVQAAPPACEDGRCVSAQARGAIPDRPCTEIGCGPTFNVAFDTGGSWPAGRYSVRVTLDGREIECSAEVPLRCDAPPACPDASVLLQLSGCALPADQQAITGLDLIGEPVTEVGVEVRSQAGVLADGSWQPSYATRRPNGADCEPACTSAQGERLSFQVR